MNESKFLMGIAAILLCFTTLGVSLTSNKLMQNTSSGRIVLKDANNAVLGYIEAGSNMRTVKNKQSQIIGYIDKNNTYDKTKKIIARSPLPGLLFCRK